MTPTEALALKPGDRIIVNVKGSHTVAVVEQINLGARGYQIQFSYYDEKMRLWEGFRNNRFCEKAMGE